MQDGVSWIQILKALVNLSGALTGLLMIIVGGMVPSAILLPKLSNQLAVISLPSTWQVPGLLLCALVCGPRAGVIAAIAYITIGLFQIPIFQDGGNIHYIQSPGFGYLIGFIPAAWICGNLAQKTKRKNIVNLTLYALVGLLIVQISGFLNLIMGTLLVRWPYTLSEMFSSYSITPLPAQLALCCSVGLLAVILRGFLYLE